MIVFRFEQAIALEAFGLGIAANCPPVFLLDLVFGKLVAVLFYGIEIDFSYHGAVCVRYPALNHAEYLGMKFEGLCGIDIFLVFGPKAGDADNTQDGDDYQFDSCRIEESFTHRYDFFNVPCSVT